VGACAAWWRQAATLGTASHTMRPHAQAAPLHRPCGWCGWCRGVVGGTLPAGVATAPRRWRIGSHRHARGGLARSGRWLASWWGRSPAHALPCWGQHQGNRSGRLRLLVEPARARCGRVCSVVGVVGVVAPGRSLGTASHALTRSGSAAAQALLVARLVSVWSVSGLPVAWPQRAAAGAVDTQAPLGMGSPGGAGGWRAGGVAHQLAPCRAGVSTRGNCSDRLRLLVGPVGARCGRVCSVVGVVHAGPVAGHRLTCAHALRQRHCTGLAGGVAGAGAVGGTLPAGVATAPRRWCVDRTGTARGGLTRWAVGCRGGAVAAQLTPGRNGGHQGKPVAPFPAKGGAFRGAVRACAVVGAVAQSVARSRSKGSHQRSQPIGARPVAGLLARRRGRGKEGFYICE
jgi:hypothetical protein